MQPKFYMRLFGVLTSGFLFTGCISHDCTSSKSNRCLFPDSHVTVGRLFEICHVPGECDKRLECEGQTALVKGSIDYANVFEHSRYPQLPYEKFFLVGDDGKILEVRAVSSDNVSLFNNIFYAQKEGKRSAEIKGTIRGFNSPVMGVCYREILFELNYKYDIHLKIR